MANFTHTITRAYRDTSGVAITATENVTGNAEVNYDAAIANPSTNYEIDISMIQADLKAMCFDCDQAVTVKTNGTGSQGALTAATVHSGSAGTGYAVGDTGTISGGTGGTYTVTGIGASGAVVAFTVGGSSSAYTTSTNVSTATGGGQPGAGSGFHVDITEIVDVISLVAGQNLVWSLATDGIGKIPVSCNVSKLYVTNASGSSANFKVRSVSSVSA